MGSWGLVSGLQNNCRPELASLNSNSSLVSLSSRFSGLGKMVLNEEKRGEEKTKMDGTFKSVN